MRKEGKREERREERKKEKEGVSELRKKNMRK